jgi:hypothetical protein
MHQQVHRPVAGPRAYVRGWSPTMLQVVGNRLHHLYKLLARVCPLCSQQFLYDV